MAVIPSSLISLELAVDQSLQKKKALSIGDRAFSSLLLLYRVKGNNRPTIYEEGGGSSQLIEGRNLSQAGAQTDLRTRLRHFSAFACVLTMEGCSQEHPR